MRRTAQAIAQQTYLKHYVTRHFAQNRGYVYWFRSYHFEWACKYLKKLYPFNSSQLWLDGHFLSLGPTNFSESRFLRYHALSDCLSTVPLLWGDDHSLSDGLSDFSNQKRRLISWLIPMSGWFLRPDNHALSQFFLISRTIWPTPDFPFPPINRWPCLWFPQPEKTPYLMTDSSVRLISLTR